MFVYICIIYIVTSFVYACGLHLIYLNVCLHLIHLFCLFTLFVYTWFYYIFCLLFFDKKEKLKNKTANLENYI